jgi:hypothetical protein
MIANHCLAFDNMRRPRVKLIAETTPEGTLVRPAVTVHFQLIRTNETLNLRSKTASPPPNSEALK